MKVNKERLEIVKIWAWDY